MKMKSPRAKALAATLAIATTALAGCASSGTAPSSDSSASPSTSVTADPKINALLPASVKDKGTLTVAVSLNYAPFEYIEDGKPTGLDVDLIKAVGDRMGVKVDIQNTPFDGILAGLASDRADIALAAFAILPKRLEQVNFVGFFNSSSIVTVLKGNSKGIDGVTTLCGHSVGVTSGSNNQSFIPALSEDCVKAGKPAINVSTFQSQTDLVQALLNSRIEATLDDTPTSAYINKQTGGKMEQVGEPYKPIPNGFAVGKNDPELLKASEAAVQSLIDDGTYGKIFEKWDQTTGAVKTVKVYTEPSDAPGE